jgi:hydrogenase/urease accessory protein HupE
MSVYRVACRAVPRSVPCLAAAAVLLVSSPSSADAHDVGVTSVARVFMDQIADRRYLLTAGDVGAPPFEESSRLLPAGCTRVPTSPAASASTLLFECAAELTADDVITLPWSLSGVVVVTRWSDGVGASAYFAGTGTTVPVPLSDLRATAKLGALAKRYMLLGVEHILLGIDHLLFIVGLLLLVRGARSLVMTITAFTVAHSVALGAAVMGVVPVNRGPVEATIALSIVLLAREVVMGSRGRVHLVHRRPWLVALAFGLLHGLGFAGALGQIGLRSVDIPLALFFFNLGVELGQLAFVVVALLASRVARSTANVPAARLKPALGYGLGALATLWFFERLPAVF